MSWESSNEERDDLASAIEDMLREQGDPDGMRPVDAGIYRDKHGIYHYGTTIDESDVVLLYSESIDGTDNMPSPDWEDWEYMDLAYCLADSILE